MGCAVKLVANCGSLILHSLCIGLTTNVQLQVQIRHFNCKNPFCLKRGKSEVEACREEVHKGKIPISLFRCLQKFIPLLRGETRILPLAWHIKVTPV